ncbi:MAG: TIGR02206 family membrane protein [Bacteroidota bacterium]
MESGFALFGPAHLSMLAAVPLMAAGLVWWSRGGEGRARQVRLCMGGILLANEILCYVYRFQQGWIQFPYGLPLHLCDAAVWLTILSLFTLKPWAIDIAYYWTLAGTSMAVLTPDLHVPFPSIPAIQYFVSHGGAVTAVLTLIWSRQARPRPGSLWKVLGVTCAAAAGVGIFNWVFDTNYLYLCRKPLSSSLLDILGPWPVYLGGGFVVACLLFLLLWLPFWLSGRSMSRSAAD